jgi:hypothetical protein
VKSKNTWSEDDDDDGIGQVKEEEDGVVTFG